MYITMVLPMGQNCPLRTLATTSPSPLAAVRKVPTRWRGQIENLYNNRLARKQPAIKPTIVLRAQTTKP